MNETVIASKIYFIRGEKVMLDRDLALLYGIETKVLKQVVKRNLKRFPQDFMFSLSKNEFSNWRSQFVTSNLDKMGLRYSPMVFTERGVAMLSGVLNSDRAIKVNKKKFDYTGFKTKIEDRISNTGQDTKKQQLERSSRTIS